MAKPGSYVVFTRPVLTPDLPLWWRVWVGLWVRPTHCFLMRWTGSSWQYFESGLFEAAFGIVEPPADFPSTLARSGDTVLYVEHTGQKRWLPLGLLSCVSVSKMIVGMVGRPFVITPAQFLRALLEDGAREVH